MKKTKKNEMLYLNIWDFVLKNDCSYSDKIFVHK